MPKILIRRPSGKEAGGDASAEEKKKSATRKVPKRKKTGKRETPVAGEVLARVRDVLLELMSASASDSVRVAAAKTLMEKMEKNKDGKDERRQNEKKRAALLREVVALLEELALAKSGGSCVKSEMDQGGAA